MEDLHLVIEREGGRGAGGANGDIDVVRFARNRIKTRVVARGEEAGREAVYRREVSLPVGGEHSGEKGSLGCRRGVAGWKAEGWERRARQSVGVEQNFRRRGRRTRRG